MCNAIGVGKFPHEYMVTCEHISDDYITIIRDGCRMWVLRHDEHLRRILHVSVGYPYRQQL